MNSHTTERTNNFGAVNVADRHGSWLLVPLSGALDDRRSLANRVL
jgi:hypothetical protein